MTNQTIKPDITLSTGRVVHHTRMSNGATDASIVGENPEMTPAEWEEYCAVLVSELNKPEPVRTWYAGKAMNYSISAKNGMTPFAAEATLAAAIASSVKARRLGLDGTISPSAEATPQDCDEAATILGWDRDPAAGDMDMPIEANIVASDMVCPHPAGARTAPQPCLWNGPGGGSSI